MDSLCFKGGILGFSSPISFGGGGGGERSIDGRTHPAQVSALGGGGGGGGRSSSGGGGGVSSSTNAAAAAAAAAAANGVGVSLENSTTTSQTRFSFTKPLGFLWGNGRNGNGGIALDESVVVGDDGREEEEEEGGGEGEGEEVDIEEELLKEEISMGGGVDELTRIEDESRTSWVLKILHVRSLWPEQQERSGVGLMERVEKSEEDAERDPRSGNSGCDHEEFCGVCEEEQEKIEFDRDSFSRLLRRVSLTEAKVYAKMSYLGNLAYSIPKIKPVNLMKYHGLRFITSSVEKKALSTNIDIEKEQTPTQVQDTEIQAKEAEEQRRHRYQISASAAYHIAASAASYLQSHTRSMISFKSSKDGTKEDSYEGDNETHGNAEPSSSEKASFVATSNSVTAVVAGKEEMKQAVAKKLNSAISSPCEWFICDDDESATRFFVIQGSETRASWQANLLFEPISFEGLDVLVHRGIYEAAKGIYEQMLPEVSAHIKSRGDSATLRFTGHSLGGSLALLVNLMLLIRGEVPLSSLLPVITFGAPSIMCGGDQLLRRLGLPRSHVRAITMHRDIVPRAFSCSYPDHVAELLKAVNGKFRNHPCLKNQKLLYSPMGEILILQPEEKFSPHHELLPSGSGLYLLDVPLSESGDAEKHLRAAQTVFFNSPHPLEILSDRSAYGSDGTIYRDHDMYSYLRSVLGVIRLEHNRIRKAKREHRRDVWWPLIAPGGIQTSIIIGRQVAPSNVMTQQHQLSFSGVLRTGRESVKRFSRLIASQHMHLLVVLLFPARLLLFGINFQ